VTTIADFLYQQARSRDSIEKTCIAQIHCGF